LAGQGNYVQYVSLPRPPLEAKPSTFNVSFFDKNSSGRINRDKEKYH